jgi:hypothetical protein
MLPGQFGPWGGNQIPSEFRALTSLGKISGFSHIDKFGRNPSAAASTLETIWDATGLYVYLTAAVSLNISSDDAADDSAGTGARTVEVVGLDSNFDDLTETVTLNGTADVATSASYLRVFRMIVRTAGSSGSNTGAITANRAAVTHAQINATINQTLMAIYTVPANKTACIMSRTYSSGKNDDAEYHFVVRPENEVFQRKKDDHLFQQTVHIVHETPIVVQEKSDIELQVISGVGSTELHGAFEILLSDN